MRAQIIQDVIVLFLESDEDNNFKITDNEIDLLILRLSVLEGVEKVNADKLKKFIKKEKGSIPAVLDRIIELVQTDSIPEKDQIITFAELVRKPTVS